MLDTIEGERFVEFEEATEWPEVSPPPDAIAAVGWLMSTSDYVAQHFATDSAAERRLIDRAYWALQELAYTKSGQRREYLAQRKLFNAWFNGRPITKPATKNRASKRAPQKKAKRGGSKK